MMHLYSSQNQPLPLCRTSLSRKYCSLHFLPAVLLYYLSLLLPYFQKNPFPVPKSLIPYWLYPVFLMHPFLLHQPAAVNLNTKSINLIKMVKLFFSSYLVSFKSISHLHLLVGGKMYSLSHAVVPFSAFYTNKIWITKVQKEPIELCMLFKNFNIFVGQWSRKQKKRQKRKRAQLRAHIECGQQGMTLY